MDPLIGLILIALLIGASGVALLLWIPYGKPLIIVSIVIAIIIATGFFSTTPPRPPDDWLGSADSDGWIFFGLLFLVVLPFRIIPNVGQKKLHWSRSKLFTVMAVWFFCALGIIIYYVQGL